MSNYSLKKVAVGLPTALLLSSSYNTVTLVDALNLVRCPTQQDLSGIRRVQAEAGKYMTALQGDVFKIQQGTKLNVKESAARTTLSRATASYVVLSDEKQGYVDERTKMILELEVGIALIEIELLDIEKNNIELVERGGLLQQDLLHLEMSAKKVKKTKIDLFSFYTSDYITNYKVGGSRDRANKAADANKKMQTEAEGSAGAAEGGEDVADDDQDKYEEYIPLDIARKNVLVSLVKVASAEYEEQKSLLHLKRSKWAVKKATKDAQSGTVDAGAGAGAAPDAEAETAQLLDQADGIDISGAGDAASFLSMDEKVLRIGLPTGLAPASLIELNLGPVIGTDNDNMPADKFDLDAHHQLARDIIDWNKILEKAVIVPEETMRVLLKRVWRAQEAVAIARGHIKQAKADRKKAVADIYWATTKLFGESKMHKFDENLAKRRQKAARLYKIYVEKELELENHKWMLIIQELAKEEQVFWVEVHDKKKQLEKEEEGVGNGEDVDELDPNKREIDPEVLKEMNVQGKKKLKLLWLASQPWNFVKYLVDHDTSGELEEVTKLEIEVETAKGKYAEQEMKCSEEYITQLKKEILDAEFDLYKKHPDYEQKARQPLQFTLEQFTKQISSNIAWDDIDSWKLTADVHRIALVLRQKLKGLENDLQIAMADKTLKEQELDLANTRVEALKALQELQNAKGSISGLKKTIKDDFITKTTQEIVAKLNAESLDVSDFIKTIKWQTVVEGKLLKEFNTYEENIKKLETVWKSAEAAAHKKEAIVRLQEMVLTRYLKKKALMERLLKNFIDGGQKEEDMTKLLQEEKRQDLQTGADEYSRRVQIATTNLQLALANTHDQEGLKQAEAELTEAQHQMTLHGGTFVPLVASSDAEVEKPVGEGDEGDEPGVDEVE